MTTEEHAHPTPAMYWKIAVLLGALTAVEVAMFYINEALEIGIVNEVVLILLAALKFVIVVGFYMHLRYEKSILSRFFTAGFFLALSLYTIILVALGIAAFATA
jgi:cytochrome c oxidase subunit 4